MVDGRDKKKCNLAFTESQWKELEQQLLTFKYIISGVPVPPQLFSTVITNTIPFSNSSCSSSSGFLPCQQSLPFGWGCYQGGYGRKIDPEPGRCRRTDGKKWRCSKEACADSKYCEKHMHRGKNKSKKNFQLNSTTSPYPTTNTIISTSPPSSTVIKPPFLPPSSHFTSYPDHMAHKTQDYTTSFYPFLPSQCSSSSSFASNFTESTQSFTAPHWLLDPQSYDQSKKEMRKLSEVKEAVNKRRMVPNEGIGYKISTEEKGERFGVDKHEHETGMLFHHFLGDWSKNATTAHSWGN